MRTIGKREKDARVLLVWAWLLAFLLPIAASGLLPSQVQAAVQGDAVRGKALFEKRCTGCHSLDQDKEGPRLRGVYGRRAGTVATFQYSAALKNAGFVWDDVSLEKWLTDTESLVPENDMAFHVASAQERGDILQFLRVASGK